MSRITSFRALARATRSYHTSSSYRSFSTRQINLGNIHGDATLVSNDNVLHGSAQQQPSYNTKSTSKDSHDAYFEPTVHSHDDVVTPHPVNRG